VDYFDDTIKTPDDLKKLFGLRSLAAVPRMKPGEILYARAGTGGNSKHDASQRQVLEAFRVLRTNLQFAAVDKELKVILVTSASPNEGKSTVAEYLAKVIAQTGRKVLVLDADLISPTLHQRFGVSNKKGLTNLIVGDNDFNVPAPLQNYPNLSVIGTGPIPPNSSELLGSARMKHLMDRLREEYDVILMDTPPILPVTDAIVASQLADGVILVVLAGRTRRGEVHRAQEMLDEAHADTLGFVLNRVRRHRGDYYYSSAYTSRPEKPEENQA
jgi:capsular exopolysaccharide synthesis family protein